MKNIATVKDALHNAVLEKSDYARGIVVGVVAAIMGQKGCLFKTALREVKQMKPAIHIENLPECWREDWMKL